MKYICGSVCYIDALKSFEKGIISSYWEQNDIFNDRALFSKLYNGFILNYIKDVQNKEK